MKYYFLIFTTLLIALTNTTFASSLDSQVSQDLKNFTTISVIGTYRLGDQDTREKAKKQALLDATRQINEQGGIYITSYTEVNNLQLTNDQIKIIAANIIRKISEKIIFTNEGTLCEAYVTAKIDMTYIDEYIKKHPTSEFRNKSSVINYGIINYGTINNYSSNVSENNPETISIYIRNDPSIVEFNNHYYKLFNDDSDWYYANNYCKSLNGHLVTINSLQESYFITNLISKYGNKRHYWTGGIKNNFNQWQWITNEPFNFNNWLSNQPDNCKGIQNCIVIESNESFIGQWDDMESTGGNISSKHGKPNFGFICEWEHYPP